MQDLCVLDELQNDENDGFYIISFKRCARITSNPKSGPQSPLEIRVFLIILSRSFYEEISRKP